MTQFMAIQITEVKVPVEKLEPGMEVVRLDRPWEETDFMLQGLVIKGQEDINDLQRQCKFVFVEESTVGNFSPEEDSDDALLIKKTSTAPPKASEKITYTNTVSIERELPKANLTYRAAKKIAKAIMSGIRLGRMIDMNDARGVVDGVVGSLLKNSDAMTWLTKLKNQDEYTAEHALNVCILSAAFARHLGHDEEEIRQIALCGLLHDVGKSQIPEEILNKEGRLTDEEFDVIKQHPTMGKDLLKTLSETDGAAIDVAHCHHERIDGKGYPRALEEGQIPYYAKIIAVTDSYDAITSNRCYESGRASMEALDIIYRCRGTQFERQLAEEFIQCVGIYPPGSIVEFTNQEVGIILASNARHKLKPRVLVVLDSKKDFCLQSIVDLTSDAKDFQGKPYAIAREIPNGTHGVDLKEFLNRGLSIDYGKGAEPFTA